MGDTKCELEPGTPPGTDVEVLQIWAAGHPPRWFAGFWFVADAETTVMVAPRDGIFRDVPVRYPRSDVRLARDGSDATPRLATLLERGRR